MYRTLSKDEKRSRSTTVTFIVTGDLREKLERLARQMEIPMDELRWFLRELVEQRQSEESHEQNRDLEEREHANP